MSRGDQEASPNSPDAAAEESSDTVAAASTALRSAGISDVRGESEEPAPAASHPSKATQQPVPDAATGIANGTQTVDHRGDTAADASASSAVLDAAAAAAAPEASHAPADDGSPAQNAKPAPYAFSGMQCVLDKASAPVCALAFGRLDSALLAFGADDGVVRVARINEQKASILHEMREQKKRITDLDWSLANDQLLTSSADGSVCLSSHDDGIWSMARRFETATAAAACLFHPVNQNMVIIGTGAGTVEVFNASTGLQLDGCRATLTSTQEEGVAVVTMDASRDALFVGDSAGYIHVLRLALCAKGALQPLVQLERIPPAGNRLASLASLSYTQFASSVKGAALLAAGTDDLVCIYRVNADRKGGRVKLELASKHLMPQSARPIRAAWCPTLPSGEPEYVALGSEDCSVYVYDVSDCGAAPVPVVRLQGHCAPTVAVAWAFDERRLASSDCDGTVIVWKREHAVEEKNEDPY